jgi:hypothetical protein
MVEEDIVRSRRDGRLSLNIALSTDARGHEYNATLIASILRRTAWDVHVRCWCVGFLPESFEVGKLKVECRLP